MSRCTARSHGSRTVLDAGRSSAAELLQAAATVAEPEEDELVRQTVADIRRRRVRGLPVDGRVGGGGSRGLHQPPVAVARVR